MVPSFYEARRGGVPCRRLQMVRVLMKTNGPAFSASRMVHDYE